MSYIRYKATASQSNIKRFHSDIAIFTDLHQNDSIWFPGYQTKLSSTQVNEPLDNQSEFRHVRGALTPLASQVIVDGAPAGAGMMDNFRNKDCPCWPKEFSMLGSMTYV